MLTLHRTAGGYPQNPEYVGVAMAAHILADERRKGYKIFADRPACRLHALVAATPNQGYHVVCVVVS